MGKSGYTTRKAAFKQIDSAIGNLDTAIYHLLNVKTAYEVDHPEITRYIDGLMQYLLIGQQYAQNIRKSF